MMKKLRTRLQLMTMDLVMVKLSLQQKPCWDDTRSSQRMIRLNFCY